ncbi:hypothetical protein GCM10023325_10470 [Sphingomonas lutea]
MAGDRRFDLLAPLPDDDNLPVRTQTVDAVEQVQQQGPAGNRVQNLMRIGSHARALPRGQDDDGEIP